jgi:tetratricopeptide (TPR) repeat protein
MYLRTPKRYTRGQRRSPISLRWLWLWILTPVVAYFGIQIYQNSDVIGPPVHEAIYNVMDNAQNTIATAAAPTAQPTQDPSERLARADGNWMEGRIEAAVDDYQAVSASAPNDVLAHYRITLGLLMEDRLEDALDAAEKTVTANPFSSDAWAIRAMALDWNGRYGEAIASALRALEIDPNNARAMAFMAEAYKDIDEPELALETVERAIEIDPNSYEAYRVRGWIYWEVPEYYDFEAAKADFQQAYDLAPNLPQQTVDLSLITSAEPDYETAIGMLRDAVELNPENGRVLFYLGNFYNSGIGDYTQAAEYLSRCVQANPESVNCQALYGRVQLSLEQYSQAAESLQRAIDLGTTSPRHYLWMGRAEVALGNCPGAVPFLQQSYELATDQDDTEAVAASAEILAECQSPVPGLVLEEATPEATPES